METKQWLQIIASILTSKNQTLSQEELSLLTTELPKQLDERHQNVGSKITDALFEAIFDKAQKGDTFGPIEKIKETFGSSLEQNYGVKSGLFLKVAQAYWTYKLELRELQQSTRGTMLQVVACGVERDFASVFFPTPGVVNIPRSVRRKKQKELIQLYAPRMDVETFLNESPILKGGNPLGVATKTAVIGLLLWLVWIFIK